MSLVFLALLAPTGACQLPSPDGEHCGRIYDRLVDAADIDAVDHDGNGVLSEDECWSLCQFDPEADQTGASLHTGEISRDSCTVSPRPAGRYEVECETFRACRSAGCGMQAGRGHAGVATRSLEAPDAIGRWLARTHQAEAASVLAFELLETELRAHGAPEVLLERCREAAGYLPRVPM